MLEVGVIEQLRTVEQQSLLAENSAKNISTVDCWCDINRGRVEPHADVGTAGLKVIEMASVTSNVPTRSFILITPYMMSISFSIRT